jgi:hypothetical protein
MNGMSTLPNIPNNPQGYGMGMDQMMMNNLLLNNVMNNMKMSGMYQGAQQPNMMGYGNMPNKNMNMQGLAQQQQQQQQDLLNLLASGVNPLAGMSNLPGMNSGIATGMPSGGMGVMSNSNSPSQQQNPKVGFTSINPPHTPQQPTNPPQQSAPSTQNTMLMLQQLVMYRDLLNQLSMSNQMGNINNMGMMGGMQNGMQNGMPSGMQGGMQGGMQSMNPSMQMPQMSQQLQGMSQGLSQNMPTGNSMPSMGMSGYPHFNFYNGVGMPSQMPQPDQSQDKKLYDMMKLMQMRQQGDHER